MQPALIRRGLFVLLGLFLVLHNDFWWWNDGRLFLALPLALAYHLLFCLGVSLLMWGLTRQAWPQNLNSTQPETKSETNCDQPEPGREQP